MRRPRTLLGLILILSLVSLVIDLPKVVPLKISLGNFRLEKTFLRPELDFSFGPVSFSRSLDLKQGLDLKGGTHLTFEAQIGGIDPADRSSAIESARENIARRVDLFGVAEPVVQTAQVGESYRLIVELAGVSDVGQAVDLIGQTAQLDFRELEEELVGTPSVQNFVKTGLTGADLARSQVQFDPNTGAPVVGLTFNREGVEKFAQITARNIGRPLPIFLDDFLLTAPRVNEEITGGEAVITGDFTLEEAKTLSIQLNAGALPVSIQLIEQRTIGPSLGASSVAKSVRAGIIGLLLVLSFMIAYYGRLGFLASVALVIYGLLTLVIYKLIPVTLTLPGVAGFILSVGMAVDSNILIFERMKEELREEKPWQVALELGFGRAWDSIRDANSATLLTCFVLFNPFDWWFLNTSGPVRGFALTLALGVILSLFTGVLVTRTILRVFYRGARA